VARESNPQLRSESFAFRGTEEEESADPFSKFRFGRYAAEAVTLSVAWVPAHVFCLKDTGESPVPRKKSQALGIVNAVPISPAQFA
jgi:hypothetical protein